MIAVAYFAVWGFLGMLIIGLAAVVEKTLGHKLGMTFLAVFLIVGILFGGILHATIQRTWESLGYIEVVALP